MTSARAVRKYLTGKYRGSAMRRDMFIRFLASIVVLCSFASAGAFAFEYRQIEGWAVSCNNAYTCNISLTSAAGASGGATLAAIQWQRSVAPSAPLTLSIPYPPGFLPRGDASGAITIAVDGVTGFSADIASLVREDALGMFGVNEPEVLVALFRRMADGARATIRYEGGIGSFSSEIVLTGLSDAARFIDDWQGRGGRTDALIDVGEKTPPESVDVWTIDSYDQLPPSVLRNLSDPESACYTDQSHIDQADAFAFSTGKSTIMLLPCGPSGAYNQPYQLYVGKDDEFHRAEFPNVSDAGITVLDTVYNVNFDLKEKLLSSVYLGRGLGDCGLAHYWTINEAAAGNPLALTLERSKTACDGVDIGPENWPEIWRPQMTADEAVEP